MASPFITLPLGMSRLPQVADASWGEGGKLAMTIILSN